MKKIIKTMLIATMGIAIPTLASSDDKPFKINNADFIYSGTADVLKNLKYGWHEKRSVFEFMHPEQYKKIINTKDDFAKEEWQIKSLKEFKAELEQFPPLDKSVEYQIELEADFGKYNFDKNYFKLDVRDSTYIEFKGNKFTRSKGLIVFKNTEDRKQRDRDKHKLFMDIDDARVFDKINPRKVLLRYTFSIVKFKDRMGHYKATNKYYPTIYCKAKNIDVMSLDGKTTYKSMSYTK